MAEQAALDIPERDYTLSFVRAAGPGGQNVNKVASAVQLRFDLRGTRLLDVGGKARLRVLAGRRLTDQDVLVLIARNHRTQEANRREALQRLSELILAARVVPRQRRATQPTRASKLRRVEGKVQHKRIKQLRGRVRDHD
ncbi:MAG TPA: alternative ribosome rescue aminoacyl-tRNA hydrolase ArfB [Steroidobacteraceae bacterium]|nr:alternative ribosome rescue aminoacyl-tRNA hydrolase ArfB [Steroidobacteraceae bacterium]